MATAARAFDAAARAASSAAELVALRAAVMAHAQALACDLVLLLLGPAQVAVLNDEGECVLAVIEGVNTGTNAGAGAASAAMSAGSALPPAAATALRAAAQAARRADIAAFRLLFLGMDQDAATSLFARMGTAAGSLRGRLHPGGSALMARDLVHVVRAAAGWRCAVWASPPPEFLA